MKQEQKAYEAPKAIIVDFDNDYVLAVWGDRISITS